MEAAIELEKRLNTLIHKVGVGYITGGMKKEELFEHFEEYLRITCKVAQLYDEKQVKQYITTSAQSIIEGKLPIELFELTLPLFNFRLVELDNEKYPFITRKPLFNSIKQIILVVKSESESKIK